ncbi:hypothetical protein MycrhDRAFT_5457 [Mycolicibacterium rhodesiae JS60]|nr:hypothetical protein MycrhDRAFT_5457 [Mycolicibacterium rhodesiae JS60]
MSQEVQAISLPPARDFLLSAGFAGVAAVVAALIVLCAVMYGSRRAGKRSLAERDQSERHHEERRADEQREVAIARCWDRWWQVLETAAIEPAASEGATLGLGPEVALELLRGLLRDAQQLGDDTLTKAVAVYQEQLLMVLAQQSGPLSRLAAEPAISTNGGPNNSPPPDKQVSTNEGSVAGGSGSQPGQRPASESATSTAPPEPAIVATPSAAQEATAGRRRR